MDTILRYFFCVFCRLVVIFGGHFGCSGGGHFTVKIVGVKHEFLQISSFFVKKRVLGYYTGFEHFFKKHDFGGFWVVASSFLEVEFGFVLAELGRQIWR